MQKVYFSRLMRVYVGLIMLASWLVLSPSFLAPYWSEGFETFLASHWVKFCANFTPTPEGNDKNSANQY